MSRLARINLPGGTYYLVQRGGAGRIIFSCPEDYSFFEQRLSGALRRHRATAYAYCWTPDAIYLVVRAGEAPVGRLMQGLTSRYARYVHRRDGGSGHFFKARYQAVLFDAEVYLSRLIRYVHHLPVLSGLVSHPNQYAYSSYPVYSGVLEIPWICVHAVRQTGQSGHDDVSLMSAPTDEDVELLRHCGKNNARVLGGPEFVASLPRHVRKIHSKVTLEQILCAVSQALGVQRDHIVSASRRRDLALARALVAWFAIERKVATLTEVSRRLNRDPSTLSVAISRYSVSRPDLFRLNALHYLTPIGPPDARGPFGRSEAASCDQPPT